MLAELPALIAAGYESVPEEDLVRLKWWGLYHDKPKIGTFMLRDQAARGWVTPAAAAGRRRALSSVRQDSGRALDAADRLAPLPRARVAAGGFPPPRRGRTDDRRARCGDAVRNVTGCPVAGLAHDELFDVTAGDPEARPRSSTATRTTPTCRGSTRSPSPPARHRCNAPEINCIALVGAIRDGEPGFGVLVGGGLSSVSRLARDLGVFIQGRRGPCPCCAPLLDAWKEDLKYRVSRVKARIKFMVDDLGPEGMRARGRARGSVTRSPTSSSRAAADRSRPHRRAAAEAGRPRLDRSSGEGRPDPRASRWSRSPSSRGARRRRAGDEAAELRPHFRRGRDVERGRRAARASSACR